MDDQLPGLDEGGDFAGTGLAREPFENHRIARQKRGNHAFANDAEGHTPGTDDLPPCRRIRRDRCARDRQFRCVSVMNAVIAQA